LIDADKARRENLCFPALAVVLWGVFILDTISKRHLRDILFCVFMDCAVTRTKTEKARSFHALVIEAGWPVRVWIGCDARKIEHRLAFPDLATVRAKRFLNGLRYAICLSHRADTAFWTVPAKATTAI
jgi:hypothetical protein